MAESKQWGDDGLTARATHMEYFGDRLIRSFDPTGRIIEEDHDLRGFVTQRREQRLGGFDVTNFVRNARGQVTSLVDPSGQTTTYTYNNFAALAGRTTPATTTQI